jgi:hypothetical protein
VCRRGAGRSSRPRPPPARLAGGSRDGPRAARPSRRAPRARPARARAGTPPAPPAPPAAAPATPRSPPARPPSPSRRAAPCPALRTHGARERDRRGPGRRSRGESGGQRRPRGCRLLRGSRARRPRRAVRPCSPAADSCRRRRAAPHALSGTIDRERELRQMARAATARGRRRCSATRGH